MNEPAVTAAAPEQPEPRRYDLFLRHRAGLFWRLTDNGIVPGPEKLSYMQDGRWGYRLYTDIVSVNVSSAHIPRQGVLAQCGITFRSGARLGTSTADAKGLPDPSRHEAYFDFLVDFHQRLVASGQAKRISFTRGGTVARMRVLQVALVLAGLIFIVLPLVLAAIVRSWQPLEIMLIGLLFVWPAWESAQKNQPGTYDPRYPPDMLD
ncbi:MAG: hypothetical protein EOP19_03315 [Hyphomicrobiales bacterium]|nr:MAG: hypothetical protein EOP19_03315 [Hyphomicrobiales bacterium]